MATELKPRTIIRWSSLRKEWIILTLLDVHACPGCGIVRQFEAERRARYRPFERDDNLWQRMAVYQKWNERDVRKEYARWAN